MTTSGPGVNNPMADINRAGWQILSGETEELEQAPNNDSPTSSSGPEPMTEEVFNRLMASDPAAKEGALESASGVESEGEVTDELRQVLVGSLLDPRLRVQGVLVLDIERDGEFYIASCDQFDEYGYGTDVINAVQDARHTIAELYWELRENQDRLGADLERTWQALSAQIYVV